MRLFVAINLPDADKSRLHRETASLRAAGMPVRWVAAESLHVTLQFLGEVADEREPHIRAVLAGAAATHQPFTLELGGVGAFPSVRRPRVFWMGIEPAPELLRLQAEVESGLESLGFAREARPFSPHLTLGRAEQGARAAAFGALESLVPGIKCRAAVEVRSVDLMRSWLSRGGARYERIGAAPLSVNREP